VVPVSDNGGGQRGGMYMTEGTEYRSIGTMAFSCCGPVLTQLSRKEWCAAVVSLHISN